MVKILLIVQDLRYLESISIIADKILNEAGIAIFIVSEIKNIDSNQKAFNTMEYLISKGIEIFSISVDEKIDRYLRSKGIKILKSDISILELSRMGYVPMKI
ncbi:MAG: hypothetical protein JHC29_02430 [Thermoplasmata archaeon]|jgi:hypothetical protein|nr:hypothetical protein [Thermoplasmata archaeon]